jgi:putative aminopeptidase FrvX
MQKEQINHNLRSNLAELSEVPNAPFLFDPAVGFIANKFDQLGIPNISPLETEHYNTSYCEDEFAVYLRIKNDNSKDRLVFTTHLDHPFFVINDKKEGDALGSVYSERVTPNTPLRIYSREGDFQGIDLIQSVHKTRNGNSIVMEGNVKLDKNNHGIWNLEPVDYDYGKIKMLSADDVATTAVCLSVIENTIRNLNQPVNVEFVFTKVEEVRQLSATGIAVRGSTPYGRFDDNTTIIPLECDYVEMSDQQRKLIKNSGFRSADYDSGLILRLNDNKIVYSQSALSRNIAETKILNSLLNTDTQYQQTLVGGACDGTSFTLFTDCPNVAGITIPTRFKHNMGRNGEVVHEEIKISDLIGLNNVITQLVLDSDNHSSKENGLEIFPRLMNSRIVANNQNLHSLRSERLKTLYSNFSQLKNGSYFPENISQKTTFLLGKLNSRIKTLLK